MIEYPEQHAPTFKQVTWHEIEAEVERVNPELHEIICELDPGPEYRLYVGEYPYGCLTVEKGQFQVPINGRMVPLTSSEVPSQWQEDLGYNLKSNPVSLVLKNSYEISLAHPSLNNTICFARVSEGTLISSTRMINKRPQQPAFIWDVSSGSKTIFMLPKISQTRKYRKLRSTLGINVKTPSNITEHWDVFREISNSGYFKPWSTQTLYFSHHWFHDIESKMWNRFRVFLLESYIQGFARFSTLYIWEIILSLILNNLGLKPDIYTNNIVRHIFQIGCGLISGLSPETDERNAPIESIQKAFTEIYEINDYIPTIISLSYYDMLNPTDITYYSLQHPNIINTPKKKDNSSNISDAYEVKSLFDKYMSGLKDMDLNLYGNVVHDMSEKTKVDVFHSHPEGYSRIKSVINLIDQDTRFSKCLCKTKNKEVAMHSTFFKGIFQITSS